MKPHKLLMMKGCTEEFSSVKGTTFYFPETVSEYIDTVILSPEDYKEIFGKKRSEISQNKKRLSVVRVTFRRKSINRRYYGEKALHGTDCCALNYSSINELAGDNPNDIIGHEVELEEGSVFAYYWYNPKAPIRMSMRLGILSIILGLIAIAISILPHCS